MKKLSSLGPCLSDTIGSANVYMIVSLLLLAGFGAASWIHRGGGVFCLTIAASVPVFLSWAAIRRWGSPQMKAALDEGVETALPTRLAAQGGKKTQQAYEKVRKWHKKSFPKHLEEKGCVGRDLKQPATQHRAQGRQGGASVARRSAAGSKNADDDGGDGGDGGGEPPRHRLRGKSRALLGVRS